MNDPSPPRRERSGLCVGGPLAGQRVPSNQGFIRVPVTVAHPVTDEAYVIDASVPVKFHEYREETFQTPQGTISFWAPIDQSPLESLRILLNGYVASHEGRPDR